MYASESAEGDVIELLLVLGAHPNLRNNVGNHIRKHIGILKIKQN